MIKKLTEFDDLSGFTSISTPSKFWIYDPTEMLIILIGWGLTFIGPIINGHF